MPLLIALQFLTRLPIRLPGVPTPEENGRSLLWYPLVGLLLGGLLLIPMLARAGIIGLMATTTYVRPQGMVSTTQSAATKSKVTVMAIILTVLALWMLPDKAVMLLLLWLALLVAYRAALNKRLGGYTGDTLGAGVEFQEVVLLVALAL